VRGRLPNRRAEDGLFRRPTSLAAPSRKGAWMLFGAALVAARCAPLTAAGSRVEVHWPPSAVAADSPQAIPDGCRLVGSWGPEWAAEADLAGPGALRNERNRAGAAGANALIVLSRLAVARRDFDCPAASPISDCPNSLGAWFEVVFRSYSCTAEGVRRLRGLPRSPSRGRAALGLPGVFEEHAGGDAFAAGTELEVPSGRAVGRQSRRGADD
jgi:hypothetical protein